MITDELRQQIIEELWDEVWKGHEPRPASRNALDDKQYSRYADRILAIPEIAEALAQKAYAERMMSHSTGGAK